MTERKDERPARPLPRTLAEAVEVILGGLSKEDKDTVRSTPHADLIEFHHGWGTAVRNDLGLWGKNSELLESCGGGHPDSASMAIIEAVWRRLRDV